MVNPKHLQPCYYCAPHLDDPSFVFAVYADEDEDQEGDYDTTTDCPECGRDIREPYVGAEPDPKPMGRKDTVVDPALYTTAFNKSADLHNGVVMARHNLIKFCNEEGDRNRTRRVREVLEYTTKLLSLANDVYDAEMTWKAASESVEELVMAEDATLFNIVAVTGKHPLLRQSVMESVVGIDRVKYWREQWAADQSHKPGEQKIVRINISAVIHHPQAGGDPERMLNVQIFVATNDALTYYD